MVTVPSASSKMAAYLARLSPIPAFPAYTGPHQVGTMDVEIPITEFNAPSVAPTDASDIPTVQFRVFYPAVDGSSQKSIPWLPNPQRSHISAYTRFLGVHNAIAELVSFLPRHLNYATIPVHKNADMKQAETLDKRWPTMIFSHGLGSNRNTYSYVAGSLASHGVVVFCPEHRDGSAIATFIRAPDGHGGYKRQSVPYKRISHDVSPEVYEQRDGQLRVRLWELGLIHQALLAMDRGTQFQNLNASTPSLSQFTESLRVHEPGQIIWAGHSFGAATMTQFLKSNYYANDETVKAMSNPLFVAGEDSDIRKQITERSITMLLDMWCMPLLSPNNEALFNLPYPCYADVPTAVGGSGLLAVESETFYKWNEHLHVKARALSPNPKAKTVAPDTYERPSGIRMTEPNFFYVVNSVHLSQSDFGILFPWVTKKIFDSEQPERALRLNLRAQLQFLRTHGVPVARTAASDLVDGTHTDKIEADDNGTSLDQDGLTDDTAILERRDPGVVDHWQWIDIIGLGDAGEKEKGKSAAQQVEEGEEKMKSELEPSEAVPPPVARTMSAAAA